NGLSCVGATGLSISAFSGEDAIASSEAQIRQMAAVMDALDCRVIVVGGDTPGSDNPRVAKSTETELAGRDEAYKSNMRQFADVVRRIAAAAGEYGVSLAMEVNWCGMCRSIRTMATMVEMVDRDNVGAVWDPAHFFSTSSRLSDLKQLQSKIIHAHLNDFRDCINEVMDINGDRVIPGQGVLPLRDWTDAVSDAGYKGYHCVELFSEDVWTLSLDEIATSVKAGCLEVWPEATF
ncbi:MAG: sugar phosphate isomerase/epimerase family protein, partial [Candidatus Latescibacteria bacterium]|nr:sugar phosphate isomerase/epimerase family protein [Candidatus Latescibacterota bacterium]